MQPKSATSKRLDKRALFKLVGYEPHAGQLEIHLSRAPRRVVACGVRWGKTWAAAMEALAAAMQPAERSIGWVVAPTYDLSERVFSQIVIVVASHLRHRIVSLKEHERRLVLRNMGGGLSEIRGKSADNPTSLLGEGLDWTIVDEAARLKPAIWESHLSQRLIDKQGWALLISTPKGKGWFYEAFRRGQGNDPDFQSWNAPSWTNPMLDAAQIEEERGRLPERVFMQEYGGQFLEGSGAVFRNVRECATGTLQEPKPGECYFAGLDLARVEDFTVLTIMNRRREVVFVDRFHRLDWALQVNRIKTAANRYNRASILVDSTGAGEPVFEAMRSAGCRVDPYGFTQKSKADLVNNLALMLEKRELVLPRPELWPEGIDELQAFEFSITDSGNVRSGAPHGMHDDCVVSLALAARQVKQLAARPTFHVANDLGQLRAILARAR
jgi:Terminase RNaseH-like domain/Terminase large subunit, T4likevirus-type, N-terminal